MNLVTGNKRSPIEPEFALWQGLWRLAVLSALAMGTLLLYVLDYLHLDGDSSQSSVMRIGGWAHRLPMSRFHPDLVDSMPDAALIRNLGRKC